MQSFRPDHEVSAQLLACAAVGEGGAPVTSIASVVDRMNALPQPATGPCFVASLPRPLKVIATTGTVSAQPAGECDDAAVVEHPERKCDARLFLMLPGVVAAVVPSGAGSKAIELGEWTSPTSTIKAEVPLPVTAPLSHEEPYTRLKPKNPGLSACGFCHREETPHPTIPDAFVSHAYRPAPRVFTGDEGEVKLKVIRAQHQVCIELGADAAAEEKERCEMYHALFDFGEVAQGAFAPEVPIF